MRTSRVKCQFPNLSSQVCVTQAFEDDQTPGIISVDPFVGYAPLDDKIYLDLLLALLIDHLSEHSMLVSCAKKHS